MIHPIPSGTRDVLPDEMRELRAITDALRGVFERAGYGEVVHAGARVRGGAARAATGRRAEPAYRLFDEHGDVLVLRSDMTIPIARVVATRYARAEPPLRFCYFAHAYRARAPAARPAARDPAGGHRAGRRARRRRARPRRSTRAVRGARRRRADGLPGRARRRVAVPARCWTRVGVAGEAARPRSCTSSSTRDFVGLEREVARCGLAPRRRELLLRVPQLRGGAEVLDAVGRRRRRRRAARACTALLDADVRRARDLRPRPGRATSATTRARCSRSTTRRSARRSAAAGATTTCSGASAAPLPAVGFALDVERLHVALAGEERGGEPLTA